MEFEANTQDKSPEVSDSVRLAASTRQVILQPIDEDVQVDLPDDYVANQHILEGPIANISTDSESTAAFAGGDQQNTRKHALRTILVALVGVAIIAGAVAAYVLLPH